MKGTGKKIVKHKNQTHKQTSIYKQHKGVKKKKFYFAAEAAEHYGSFMEHMEHHHHHHREDGSRP